MTTLPTGVPSQINGTLNFLCNKLELLCVFLLFLGFFDANLEIIPSGRETFFNASYAIVLFLLILRWKRCIYLATKDISLLLLVATALASYFWSAAPEYTLIETKSFIRSILIGVYIAARYGPHQLMPLFTGMFGAAVVLNCLFSAFAIATHQSYLTVSWINGELAWTGFLTHKQYLGRMMIHAAMVLLLSALSIKRFRWVKLVVFSLAIIQLLLSNSKTAWLIFTVSLTLFPILKLVKLQYKVRTMLYILAVFIFASIAIFISSNLEILVVGILHKPPDFNGRFEIWSLVIEQALKRPWLGYGYAGFWTSDACFPILKSTWAATQHNDRFHSHNGFLDIFLQLGILGFSLFIFNFLAVLRRVIKLIHLTKTIDSFWMLEFLVLAFLFQLAETLTLISINTLCSIYVSIGLSTIVWQNRIKRSHS